MHTLVYILAISLTFLGIEIFLQSMCRLCRFLFLITSAISSRTMWNSRIFKFVINLALCEWKNCWNHIKAMYSGSCHTCKMLSKQVSHFLLPLPFFFIEIVLSISVSHGTLSCYGKFTVIHTVPDTKASCSQVTFHTLLLVPNFSCEHRNCMAALFYIVSFI